MSPNCSVFQLLQLAMVDGYVDAVRGLVVLPAAQPGLLSLGDVGWTLGSRAENHRSFCVYGAYS